MTTRGLSQLEKLAVEVAISAPVTQGKYSVTAGIPWAVVKDIRVELSRHGIDWKEIRKEMLRIKKERQAERGVKADACGNIQN